MTDFTQMHNLMNNKAEPDILFKDVQPFTRPDTNRGSYSSGQLNYDTREIGPNVYWCQDKATLLFPMTANITGVLAATNCLGSVTGTTSGITGPVSIGSNGYGN